jgi:spoIIIJ-associated protein
MGKFEATTLEEAYNKACKEYGCSILELDIEVIQAPSSGILGLFKKSAIIEAHPKSKKISQDNSTIVSKIESGINELLQNSCFDIELKEVEIIDNDTVYIKIDGEDAALMIGKEGYRYKALSYMLHNWIKIKYDKNISLEIAEFLKNQKSAIDEYINSFKERVDSYGKAQTKPLDGILIKLALEKLRELYPNKHVAIRTLRDGRKVVAVSDFRKEKR